MSAPDAELYLRLLSERELLRADSRNRGARDAPLEGVAEALVAAGAIDGDVARRVVEDDMFAREARGDGLQIHRRHHSQRGRHRPLEHRSAAVIGERIDLEDGTLTLHEIIFGAERSTLRYSWRAGAASGSRGRGSMSQIGSGGRGVIWSSVSPSIVDAAGHRPTVTSGSGGGSDGHWDGELELRGRLDPETSWLQFDDIRVQLRHRTALLSVEIEPLEPEPALERHLWRRLTGDHHPFRGGTDPAPALEALTSLGVLADSDPFVSRLRAVSAAMPDHPHHQHGSRGGRNARRLPEPWRSLLGRLGRNDGPSRSLLVAATSPVFDDLQVGVHVVISDPTGFDVHAEVSPGRFAGAPFGSLPVAWWARDDRGNHYLGAPSAWGGDADHSEGTLRHWPALDPKATRLELMPTASDHRAVIAISLADPGSEATP